MIIKTRFFPSIKALIQRNLNHVINIGLAFFLSLVYYLLMYSKYPLYFSNLNWIFDQKGDLFQHYIGWEWFRQSPWRFPLGSIPGYGYPIGTNLLYTDSIPLLAIPLKLFSPLLQTRFQYLGIWELLSIFGQMLVGVFIFKQFTNSRSRMFLGASLLVFSPPMIYRAFYHNSLSAHWILLLAILFIILEIRNRLWHGSWFILFILAFLIHIYFVAMLIPLWFTCLYFQYRRNRKVLQVLISLLIMICLLFILGYSFGLFDISVSDAKGWGYGYFSWNINGFLNPLENSSALIREMDVANYGQVEGYSYLGLGYLLLVGIAFILFLQREYDPKKLELYIPFLAVSLLFTAFAVTNEAYLNDLVIWKFQIPEKVFNLASIFRNSGRFIWPVFYLGILFGIIVLIRNLHFSEIFLLMVLCLQIIDIQPLFSSRTAREFTDYQSPLKSQFWEQAAQENKHLILLPTSDFLPSSDEEPFYEPFALLAVNNHLTMNTGYFSRSNSSLIKQVESSVLSDLKSGLSDPDTLYVFWGSLAIKDASADLSGNLVLCDVDGFLVGFSTNNPLTGELSQFDVDCQFPSQ